jgi:hypothetical protein
VLHGYDVYLGFFRDIVLLFILGETERLEGANEGGMLFSGWDNLWKLTWRVNI